MTDELFDKAYELKRKLWDLHAFKEQVSKVQLIRVDYLPFFGRNTDLIGDVSGEVETASKELSQKYLNRIDDMIKEVQRDFDEL
jgi:hypothetical protein